jgi:Family of unknown function (DUF6918)
VKQLKDIIEDEAKRKTVVADCVVLVNSEVKSKGGLSGLAVKAAFALVKAIKPRILEESVDGLIDDFVEVLQPHYESFQSSGSGTLETYLDQRGEQVAESLLGITDRRAERSSNKTMVKAYKKLRPKGKVHVEQAVPGIGRVLNQHTANL